MTMPVVPTLLAIDARAAEPAAAPSAAAATGFTDALTAALDLKQAATPPAPTRVLEALLAAIGQRARSTVRTTRVAGTAEAGHDGTKPNVPGLGLGAGFVAGIPAAGHHHDGEHTGDEAAWAAPDALDPVAGDVAQAATSRPETASAPTFAAAIPGSAGRSPDFMFPVTPVAFSVATPDELPVGTTAEVTDSSTPPGDPVGLPGTSPAGERAPLQDPALLGVATAFVPVIPGTPVVPDLPPDGAVTGARPELHPLFRDRLERVIERMASEFGYTVEVVETTRSQERQDALYAQGRQAPGQVVTWTRNSRHTEGLAADLIIDGSWTNRLGFERLAQVAREEGLRTLGPRDRGHVELSRAALAQALASDPDGITPELSHQDRPAWSVRGALTTQARSTEQRAATVLALNPNDASRGRFSSAVPTDTTIPAPDVERAPAEKALPDATGIARVAAPAPVASVAQVAEVARVATIGAAATSVPPTRKQGEAPVARTVQHAVPTRQVPAEPGPVIPTVNDGESALAPSLAPATTRSEARSGDGEQRGDGRQPMPVDRARHDTESPTRADERLGSAILAAFDAAGIDHSTSHGRTDGLERTASAGSTDRVAQLLDLRETAAERPLSSVLLRLDSPDGGEDRVRIDLRGSTIGAALDMADRGLADDLGRHVAELARSLERQGLDPESLTVRVMNPKDATSAYSQAAAGERDGLRAAALSSSAGGSMAGRDGRATRQDAPPQDEQPRQRARRDPKGDR